MQPATHASGEFSVSGDVECYIVTPKEVRPLLRICNGCIVKALLLLVVCSLYRILWKEIANRRICEKRGREELLRDGTIGQSSGCRQWTGFSTSGALGIVR